MSTVFGSFLLLCSDHGPRLVHARDSMPQVPIVGEILAILAFLPVLTAVADFSSVQSLVSAR